MKLWAGVTDKNWFGCLANISPDEVNFWKLGKQGFSITEIKASVSLKFEFMTNLKTNIF